MGVKQKAATRLSLTAAKKRRSNHDYGIRDRLWQMGFYPSSSTGTNYNLIDNVEHIPSDRVIWPIIRSPEGSFTYDYSIKSVRRRRNAARNPNVPKRI